MSSGSQKREFVEMGIRIPARSLQKKSGLDLNQSSIAGDSYIIYCLLMG
jgi:hypothetical protein